jgi:hypothetical protein
MAGYRKVYVEATSSPGGGLHVEVEVPGQLAGPVRVFIAALGSRQRIRGRASYDDGEGN